MAALLAILDGALSGRTWLAGDEISVADIAMGPIVKRCLEFPIERPSLPGLEKWRAAIETRPAFQVAIGAKPSVTASAA